MNYVLFVLFCILLNAVSPRSRSDQEFQSPADLQLITKITTQLTESSQKNLQLLIKRKLVEDRQIPETASINIESIYLDKKHQDVFAKQNYIVKTLASWTSFFPHKCKVGLYVLKMNKHNDYFVSCFSNDSLKQAQVNLPT